MNSIRPISALGNFDDPAAHPCAYHYNYGGGTVDWLTHMVVSSVVHAIIFNVVFRVLHELTLMQVLVLAGIVLAVIFVRGRARDRRGW